MKVTTNITPIPSFTPFSINLEFETAEEVEKFYAIFNYGPLCDKLKLYLPAEQIRKALLSESGMEFNQLAFENPFHKVVCEGFVTL